MLEIIRSGTPTNKDKIEQIICPADHNPFDSNQICKKVTMKARDSNEYPSIPDFGINLVKRVSFACFDDMPNDEKVFKDGMKKQ